MIPDKMPPREDWTKPPPPTVIGIPRVFNVWGTLLYSASSFTAFACMVALPFWTPPWWLLLSALTYVFLSTGIIALGRIEGNKDARVFIAMLKRVDEDNKRRMN